MAQTEEVAMRVKRSVRIWELGSIGLTNELGLREAGVKGNNHLVSPLGN